MTLTQCAAVLATLLFHPGPLVMIGGHILPVSVGASDMNEQMSKSSIRGRVQRQKELFLQRLRARETAKTAKSQTATNAVTKTDSDNNNNKGSPSNILPNSKQQSGAFAAGRFYVPPAVDAVLRIKHYVVHYDGINVTGLVGAIEKEALTANPPEGYFAKTLWDMSYSWRVGSECPADSNTKATNLKDCRLTEVSMPLEMNVTVPKVLFGANTPQYVQTEYQRWYEETLEHEMGHVTNANEFATKFSSVVQVGTAYGANEAETDATITEIWNKLHAQSDAVDKWYDSKEVTDHGRKYGAEFTDIDGQVLKKGQFTAL